MSCGKVRTVIPRGVGLVVAAACLGMDAQPAESHGSIRMASEDIVELVPAGDGARR